jgi:hypothetical protein
MDRVVVEGGGPIGLLSTFRLFMAGMEVTMVNDRMEYNRPQLVLFDSNWQAQLRYLLGTKFDQLFDRKTARLISIKYMEIVVKNRLLEFVEFLKEKLKSTKLPMELIYGSKIVDLESPKSGKDPNFYAILKENPTEKISRIPLDFFVCAGGANDQMREKLFGLYFLTIILIQKYNFYFSLFFRYF